MTLVVLGVLLAPFVRHGFRFGLGPDIPVYLWWTRVGASQGLSIVGERPGSPALFAVLTGATHLPVAAVTAGFEAAFGAAIGAGVGMLVRAAGVMAGERRGARAAWVLAGLLAGLFTVHLAAGYLANLAFAAPFVAASVFLAVGTRRSTLAAAVTLGGGGLAHPQFFVTGILVLAAVGVWSAARRERGWESDAGRVAAATLGGGAVVVSGLLTMTIGPAHLAVDTSKDGFLRRAGMADAVRHAYFERTLHRWTRYVQWLALPLAALGSTRTNGFARRVLVAWTALVVVGAPIGLITGWFPADRLITFGFSVPALAGVGVVAVWLWLQRRVWLATLVAAALVGLMAAGALISWSRQEPFISPLEVQRATTAARIAGSLEPGTPLVFIVDDADSTVSFLATRAANVLRAAMPPDRADDVYVYVGTPHNFIVGEPTIRGSAEYDAMSRLYLADIPKDTSASGGRVRPRPVRPYAGRRVGPRPVPLVAGRVRHHRQIVGGRGRPRSAATVISEADRGHGVRPAGPDRIRGVRLGAMGGARPARRGRRRAGDRRCDARDRRRRARADRVTALRKRGPDGRRARGRRDRLPPARPAGQGRRATVSTRLGATR